MRHESRPRRGHRGTPDRCGEPPEDEVSGQDVATIPGHQIDRDGDRAAGKSRVAARRGGTIRKWLRAPATSTIAPPGSWRGPRSYLSCRPNGAASCGAATIFGWRMLAVQGGVTMSSRRSHRRWVSRRHGAAPILNGGQFEALGGWDSWMTWSATAGRLIVINRVAARPTHRAAEAVAANAQAVLWRRTSSAWYVHDA